MPKKPRPDPYTQGSYRTIYEKFFGPLIYYKPNAYTIKDWLEALFHLKGRDIIRYVAKRPFEMPGLFYQSALIKTQGLGYRAVPEGTEVFARIDDTTPDNIDVEFCGGQGGAIQVFALNQSEWGWVKLQLDEAERKRKD